MLSGVKNLPQLKQWDTYSRQECEQVALSLEEQLPPAFHYVKLEAYSQGDQHHWAAFFECQSPCSGNEPLLFVFLPGCDMTLGYDRDCPLQLMDQQLESWKRETAGRGSFFSSLPEFLDQILSPLRQVTIEPFLLQVQATYPAKLRVRPDGRKSWLNFIYFDEIHATLKAEGFSLPNENEWEYACSAGSRTLFRWGTTTPPYRIPRVDPDSGDEEILWYEHLKPNAFGLSIASDPYHWEMCAEGDRMLGGDGGTAIHSGFGTFAEWLTLSSWFYREIEDINFKMGGIPGARYRRKYSLEGYHVR